MKKIFTIICILWSVTTYAGLKELTWHSRANCVNNESITWHFNHSYNLWTKSEHSHYPDGDPNNNYVVHTRIAEWKNTWRSAAVDWNEAYPSDSWGVKGTHYIRDKNNQPRKLGEKYVYDCSIYDGWWDK